MNREALDEFFAKAEDVLTDWHGGTDAMHARVPVSDEVEAMPGDSYYEQPSRPFAPRGIVATAPVGTSPFTGSEWVDIGYIDEAEWTVTMVEGRTECPAIFNETREYRQRYITSVVATDLSPWLDVLRIAAVEMAAETATPLRYIIDEWRDEHLCLNDPERQSALDARRNRNTGPVSRRGLDGFHR